MIQDNIEPDDQIHSGDDELLDMLTGVRTAIDDILNSEEIGEEFRESLQGALEDLDKADAIRIAEIKAQRAYTTPPVAAQEGS